MKKPKNKKRAPDAKSDLLKGWTQISQFLGQPVGVAQRWARSGMLVKREGRFMTASPDELSGYVGREAGLNVPVHIASEDMDLSADLKRALSITRHSEKKER